MAAFLASGGLWRSPPLDRETQRLQRQGILDEQHRIDAMSEDELNALVHQMNKVLYLKDLPAVPSVSLFSALSTAAMYIWV